MPWQHKTLARMDFLCEPWRRLTPCLFLHRFLLTDQIWDRNLVLGAVEKQCSLLFCGSVVFNLRLAGGHRERWRQERERKAGARRRESQWFPQAPVSIVSPVAHLTHSLCWAMGKSDWAHYPLLRTDTGSVRRARERESLLSSSLWMDTIASVVTIRNVWPSAEANLALLCLPASVRWKQMSALTVSWCSHGRSELRLLACVVSPTRPGAEWEGMDGRYREGHVR